MVAEAQIFGEIKTTGNSAFGVIYLKCELVLFAAPCWLGECRLLFVQPLDRLSFWSRHGEYGQEAASAGSHPTQ